MKNYSDGYKKGLLDKETGKEMDYPCAVSHVDAFNGYFHGYGKHQYNPPDKRQLQVAVNIKKYHWIT